MTPPSRDNPISPSSSKHDNVPVRSGSAEKLSVREAVRLYELSRKTLEYRLRTGEIPASKIRGPRGYEWRVAPEALENFGYKPRSAPLNASLPVAEVKRVLERLDKTLAAQIREAERVQQSLHDAREEVRSLQQRLQ